MNNNSSWYEATVNYDDEYFTLYHHGTSKNSDTKQNTAVAKLGYWQWQEELFPVEFLTDDQTLITKAVEQLDFYLNQLPKEKKANSFADTWRYAKYHCGTSANIYSSIQWAYFPVNTNKSVRKKSRKATSLSFFQKCQTIIHTHYKNVMITIGFILPFLQPKTSPWWGGLVFVISVSGFYFAITKRKYKFTKVNKLAFIVFMAFYGVLIATEVIQLLL